MPNDWFLIETGEVCEENQYNYFKELFEESSKRGFIKGFCLWDWPIKSPQNAKDKYEKDYFEIWRYACCFSSGFYNTDSKFNLYLDDLSGRIA